MGAAITALSWELLASCRWRMRLAATGLVLLCLIGLTLPESWRSQELGGWLIVFCLLTPVVLMLNTLSHAEGGRLEDAGSLFPRRLFTLPVPSVVLAAPPLVLGTLLLLGGWIVSAVILLRPWGVDAPLFWPGLAASAVLACLQAILWFPFTWRWLRAAALMLIVTGLINGTVVLAHEGISEIVISSLSFTVLLVGYACAFLGVAQGRHGKGTHAAVQFGALSAARAQKVPPPFLSPLRAQQWLERQRMMSGFLIMMGICILFALGMVCLSDFVIGRLLDVARAEDLDDSISTLRNGLLTFGRSWLIVIQMPLLPLLISSSIGSSTLGKLTSFANSLQPSAFLATRPMQTADMMKAKLLTCVWFEFLLWGLIILTGFLWAACMGRLGEMSDYLLTWTGSVPTAILALMTGMILLPIISWLWLVSGIWVGIVRRGLLEGLPALLTIGLFVTTILLISDKLDSWRTLLGIVVAVALVAKVFAIGWVGYEVRRANLVSPGTLTAALAGWCLLAIVVVGVVVGLLSVGPLMAGIVVLLLPLARPLAAPLALARHRTQ